MTTDSFVVKPIRFPGGSIGELAVNGTVNDLADGRRAPARAHALARARGGPRRRRPARRGRGDRRARRAAAGVEIVAGDTKVVERGTLRLDVRDARPGSGASTRAPRSRRASLRPGDRILVSGPIGEHGTADHARPRRVRARGAESSPTRARSGPPSTRCSRPPGPRCAACATRRAAASPRCSTSSRAPRRRDGRARGRGPGAPGGRRRLRDPRHRPDVRRERGRARRVRRARGGRRGARRAARRRPAASGAAEIGEVKTEPPGMVLVETAFGGRRVMDLLVGDPLPRIC